MLNSLGQTEQEIRCCAATRGARVAGKLPVKVKLAGEPSIARIEVVLDITVDLKAGMQHVLATGQGKCVFKLQGCVMERLHQVIISDGTWLRSRASESNRGQEGVTHAGDAEYLRQILSCRIGEAFSHREVGEADASIVQQVGSKSVRLVNNEVL